MFGGGRNMYNVHPHMRRHRHTHHQRETHHDHDAQPEATFSFGCIQMVFIMFILFVSMAPTLLSGLFVQRPSSSHAEHYGSGYYHFEKLGTFTQLRKISYNPPFSNQDYTVPIYFPADVIKAYGDTIQTRYRSRILTDYKTYLTRRCEEKKFYDKQPASDSEKRSWLRKRPKYGNSIIDTCDLLNEIFG